MIASQNTPSRACRGPESGFTLIELLVTMLIFIVIAAATVQLMGTHVKLFSGQQNQAGLNVAMRQTIAQLQTDLVNAGAGYYTSVNAPGSPVGITIVNGTATNCYNTTTYVYNSGCFDTLNVLTFDSVTPTSPSGTGTIDLSQGTGTLILTPSDSSVSSSTIIPNYQSGDTLLLLSNVAGSPSVLTVTLAAAATANTTVANGINISFAKLNSDGTNPSDYWSLNSVTTKTTTSAGVDSTWYVLKISPVQYRVDTTDSTNPQLKRILNNGIAQTLVDHVVAFKVGAQIWNSSSTVSVHDGAMYYYDPTVYYSNYANIRGVRVTLVGRTPLDVTSGYKNSLDQQPYRIEALSTVVSPRNLSMNDGN